MSRVQKLINSIALMACVLVVEKVNVENYAFFNMQSLLKLIFVLFLSFQTSSCDQNGYNSNNYPTRMGVRQNDPSQFPNPQPDMNNQFSNQIPDNQFQNQQPPGQFPNQQPNMNGQTPNQQPNTNSQFPNQTPNMNGQQFPNQQPNNGPQFPNQQPNVNGQPFSSAQPNTNGQQFQNPQPNMNGQQFPNQQPNNGQQFPNPQPNMNGQQFLNPQPNMNGQPFSNTQPIVNGQQSPQTNFRPQVPQNPNSTPFSGQMQNPQQQFIPQNPNYPNSSPYYPQYQTYPNTYGLNLTPDGALALSYINAQLSYLLNDPIGREGLLFMVNGLRTVLSNPNSLPILQDMLRRWMNALNLGYGDSPSMFMQTFQPGSFFDLLKKKGLALVNFASDVTKAKAKAINSIFDNTPVSPLVRFGTSLAGSGMQALDSLTTPFLGTNIVNG